MQTIQSMGPKKGYMAELVVVADLMLRGYEVYSSQRVGNRFDCLIIKDGIISTVEVKFSEKLKLFPLMLKTKPDILALVNSSKTIRYIPDLAPMP